MNKKFIFISLIIFFGVLGFAKISLAACGGSSPAWTAADASYTEVADCVNKASRGDTINIPADSKTWTSVLTITKGLTLKGAGIGKTVIISTRTRTSDPCSGSIIGYQPDTTAIVNNEIFDVSGFTFESSCAANGGTCSYLNSGTLCIHSDSTTPISNIKIHSNRFNQVGKGIGLLGNIYGVAWNNQFEFTNTGSGYMLLIDGIGNARDSWDNHPVSFGTSQNFYFEDNIIDGNNWSEGGGGGRYAIRYNVFDNINYLQHLDMHGNQGNGIYATMMTEVYGNIHTNSQRPSGTEFMEQRGGQTLFFNNNVISGTPYWWIYVTDETDDALDPCDSCVQHPVNSYYWNNFDPSGRKNALLKPGSFPSVAENSEFFNYNASCVASSCSSGIGVGSTAPAGTCTTGVGYWVTSFSPAATPPATIADMKIHTQTGTLYKCTEPNVWTAYYTPYTYPHPLRAEATSPDTTPPASPTGVKVI